MAGRPLLEWSLLAFAQAGSIGAAVVAAPPGHEAELRALIERAGGELTAQVVAGGASRSESVAAAAERVDSEITVVHDAARPVVTAGLIDAVVEELLADDDCQGVAAATPLTDTIKHTARGREVDSTLDRSSLWAAQTPQAFRTEALRRAHASTELLAQATDDAMLLERLGAKVLLHEAPPTNVKVTTELDLRVAELLLSERR